MKTLTVADIMAKYAMSETTVRRRLGKLKPAKVVSVKDAAGMGHLAYAWEPASIGALFQKKKPAKRGKGKK